MEDPELTINTSMSKADYRKFLYLVSFKKNKLTIPFLALFTLVVSLIASFNNGLFHLSLFVVSWILLFMPAIGVIVFKVERKYKQRLKTDKTGTLGSVSTLKFYDDRIVMENPSLKSTGELKYDQFFSVLESRDYFILYLNAHQASMVRKADVGDLDHFKGFVAGRFGGRYRKI